MFFIRILIFLVSALMMAFAGSLVVESLIKVAKTLKWREFVGGFVVMAIASSMPNLFVGITSALKGIPELSFGDVVGGNAVDLTLVIALGALLSEGLIAESRMVQSSGFFTIGIGLLPLLLMLDGKIGRIDAIILLLAFMVYSVWLFSKEERFRKVYEGTENGKQGSFAKSILLLLLGIGLLVAGSQGVVTSALYFAKTFMLPIGLVGIVIVGFGNCLPELYFTIVSSQKKQSWLILGNIMGSVIASASLVLAIAALIHPITISNFSPYILGRLFMVLAAISFMFFLRSGRKISKKEAIFLLAIYVLFLIGEIVLHSR